MQLISMSGFVDRIFSNQEFLFKTRDNTGKPWKILVILKEGLEPPDLGAYIYVTGELEFSSEIKEHILHVMEIS